MVCCLCAIELQWRTITLGRAICVALNEQNQLLAIISWHVQSWSLHERKNAIAYGLPMPPGWLLILAFKLKAHYILGIHFNWTPMNTHRWNPQIFVTQQNPREKSYKCCHLPGSLLTDSPKFCYHGNQVKRQNSAIEAKIRSNSFPFFRKVFFFIFKDEKRSWCQSMKRDSFNAAKNSDLIFCLLRLNGSSSFHLFGTKRRKIFVSFRARPETDLMDWKTIIAPYFDES